MAEISAVIVSRGTDDFPGPTAVQFQLTGFTGNEATGIMLSPTMVTSDEVDYEVDRLVAEAKKAGGVAKRMLSRTKTHA